MVTTYGDYKTVDGITIAYSMQSYVKGKDLGRQALNVTKIDLNPKVDKSFFTMPAAR